VCNAHERNSSNNYWIVAILNWIVEAMSLTINHDVSVVSLRQGLRKAGCRGASFLKLLRLSLQKAVSEQTLS